MIGNILRKNLVWTIQKIGQNTLLSISFLASILFVIALSVQNVLTGDYGYMLVLPTFLGLILSWGFARSKTPVYLSLFFIILIGLFFVLINTLELWGLFFLLMRTSFDWVRDWIIFLLSKEPLLSSDIQSIWRTLVLEVASLFSRTSSSWHGLLSGIPIFDPLVARFTWSLLFWFVSSWAGWVYRYAGQPIVSLLPAGVIFASSLSLTRSSTYYLVPFIIGLFLFLTWNRYQKQQEKWEKQKTDVAEAINLDIALWVSAISMSIIFASLLLSAISPQKIFQSAREFAARQSNTTQEVGQTLGLEQQEPGSQAAGSTAAGSLPRSYLIGSSPELSQEIALIIKKDISENSSFPFDDEQVASKLYFRSLVYDQYTGTGWKTSLTFLNPIEAGDLIYSELISHPAMVYKIEYGIQPGEALVYPGNPIRLTQPVQVEQRDTEEGQVDIFAIITNRSLKLSELQIETFYPKVSETQLQNSASEYPRWITDRYLQLPDRFPARVQDLSQEITQPHTTPYEKAKAIESYLRNFPYSLDIPQPPTNTDISDYFLFEIKRGYCDYYATAMTVMARSIGIPARLVVGYTGGVYNPETGRNMISKADAHSWVEIYFPGIGWVEFEPTSSLGTFIRPLDTQPNLEVSDIPQQTQASPSLNPGDQKWFTWIIAIAGIILVLATIWHSIDLWHLKQLDPVSTINKIYWRFVRLANRAYLSDTQNPTPNEFQDELLNRISDLHSGKLSHKLILPQKKGIRSIIQNFNLANYSPTPASYEMQAKSIKAWLSLRTGLWLVERWSKFRRTTGL